MTIRRQFVQMALLYRRVCAIKGLKQPGCWQRWRQAGLCRPSTGELPRPVLHPQDQGYLLFAISEMANACIWGNGGNAFTNRRGFEASEECAKWSRNLPTMSVTRLMQSASNALPEPSRCRCIAADE